MYLRKGNPKELYRPVFNLYSAALPTCRRRRTVLSRRAPAIVTQFIEEPLIYSAMNNTSPIMEVESLIQQMQDTLADIRAAVNQASGKSQNDELDQLEQKRDSQLAELKSAFEKEKQDLEGKRRTELEDLKKKRKQEDEEREARRKQEDEELAKAKSTEDKQRKKKHDKEANSIEDETGRKMDEVEEQAQKMAQEGVQKMKSLAERRNVSRSITIQRCFSAAHANL